ncbi:MAG: LruC domain-containing protein [Planctomycetaceae bacterium]|jgi:LruC domain-containing protein
MKFAKPVLLIAMLCVAAGTQATVGLLSGTLNDQTVFAHTYVTLGAGGGQEIYGNVLANHDVTIGAIGNISGNTQSRALTTGDSATIGGNALTSAASTIGASSIVSGNLQSGSAITLGANANVAGTVEYGTAITNGAGATSGTQTQNTTAPVIADEHLGVTAAQSALDAMAGGSVLATGNIATNTTFTAGVYDVTGLLSTTADITITLDAQGQDSAFVFNISGYLSFGAGTVIDVINATDNTSVVWNSTGGYVSVGANANILGTVLASTYVSTGAFSSLTGSGTSCGGAFSATSYVTVGANATVGGTGCAGAINNFIIEDDGVASFVSEDIVSLIDFGDAPDSYGTTLANNGARHNLEGSAVYLGDGVDSEVQANVSPGSDDATHDDDEDGVVFITDIAAGEIALVAISSVGSGFLNAWIDLNRDGEFLESEQVIESHPISGGSEIMSLQIPEDIVSGASWSRFRVSSTSNDGPTGAVADGEVEDHPVELFGRRVTANHFPSATGFVTLAYEDLWPGVGDYDMNDLVMYYRTTINAASVDNNPQEQSLYSINISGQVTAVGAALHSGFGVEIIGLPRSSVDQSSMSLVINGVQRPGTFLEQGADYENAVFIIFDDVWEHVSAPEGCKFFRTEYQCGGSVLQSQFTLTVPVSGNISAQVIDDPILNPFIFRSDARGMEIHLKNKPPTNKASMSNFGSADDWSSPGAGIYYQTSNGLPWAMVVSAEWIHPGEARDLVQTYPRFEDYVTSGGTSNTDWYKPANAVISNLYKD